MHAANIPIKGLYWPLCRAYARLRGDRPADALLRFLCGFLYWYIYRTWPEFVHPRKFSERVWSLQLHGRDPRLTAISDKLGVRDYVAAKGGRDFLIPLLWSGADPGEIPFDSLPRRFMLKANHGCGFLLPVNDCGSLDRKAATRQVRKWLEVNYCEDTYLGIAWAYKHIQPRIVAEVLLEENGKPPVDFKFWCFGGRVEFVSLHFDRFSNHSTLSLDSDLRVASGLHFDLPQYRGSFARPANYPDMVSLAETLARDFPFMRVDLYSVGGHVYFGEMTPYPGGVTSRFEPPSVDLALGSKWRS